MNHLLNDPPRSPPSEEECKWYFYGLPYTPRLIARSGNDKWSLYNGETIRVKSLHHAGGSDIMKVWHTEEILGTLRYAVMEALRDVKWCVMDLVRVRIGGDPRTDKCIILVTVDPHYNPGWAVADRAVREVKRALDRWGLYRVECEMKEAYPDPRPSNVNTEAKDAPAAEGPAPK